MGFMWSLGLLLGSIPQQPTSVIVLMVGCTSFTVPSGFVGAWVQFHAAVNQFVFGGLGPARVRARVGYGFHPSGMFVAKLGEDVVGIGFFLFAVPKSYRERILFRDYFSEKQTANT